MRRRSPLDDRSPASFLADRHGSMAVYGAFALSLMLIVSAVALESSNLYLERMKAQRAADLSTLAAAGTRTPVTNGQITVAARAAALSLASANGYPETTVTTAATKTRDGQDGISTTIDVPVPLNLGRLISDADLVNVSVASSATLGSPDRRPTCIIALNSSQSYAFEVDDQAQLDAPDCKIKVNSSSSRAATFDSQARVNVSSIEVIGSYRKASSASVTPTPVQASSPAEDPYAAIPNPVGPPCGGAPSINGGTVTLEPSRSFCGGLVIDNAMVTFSPGTYVIDGYFTLRSGAVIHGTDVTIFMRGQGGQLFFHSGTSFNLSAPTTGPHAGIVLWSDKANTSDSDIYSRMGATAAGTFYFPSSQLEIENRVAWSTNCIRFVVGRLQLDYGSRYVALDPARNCHNNIGAGKRARLYD